MIIRHSLVGTTSGGHPTPDFVGLDAGNETIRTAGAAERAAARNTPVTARVIRRSINPPAAVALVSSWPGVEPKHRRL
jgi:hypothetical protein